MLEAGVLSTLAAVRADPPVPTIFYQEHDRFEVVLDKLNEVYEANNEDDYTALIGKVEVMIEKDDIMQWTVDREFEEKAKEDQVKIVDIYLKKLMLEHQMLLARPRYWILRTHPDGLDDQVCWDPSYTPEVDINEDSSPSWFVAAEAAAEATKLAPLKHLNDLTLDSPASPA